MTGNAADAGDDAGGGDVVFVDAMRGEGAELQEGGGGVEKALNALAGEELATLVVAGDVLRAAPSGDSIRHLSLNQYHELFSDTLSDALLIRSGNANARGTSKAMLRRTKKSAGATL